MSTEFLFLFSCLGLCVVVLLILGAGLFRRRLVPEEHLSNLVAQYQELAHAHATGSLTDEAFTRQERVLARGVLAVMKRIEGRETRPMFKGVTYVALTLVVFCVSGAFYLVYGDIQALLRQKAQEVHVQEVMQEEAQDRQGFETVERLEAQVKKNPKDAEAWSLLAEHYEYIGEPDKLVNALMHLTQLHPMQKQLWVRYADALVWANNGQVNDVALKATQKALALDPKDAKARLIQAVYEYQTGDFEAALTHFEALSVEVPQLKNALSVYIEKVKASQSQAREDAATR